jgi:UDPglucose--hexose-1-phosphate uridylyltransferase
VSGPPTDGQPALHLRHDALTDRWVAISPVRNVRPQTRSGDAQAPDCPLCVGGPEVPFPYEAAVFDNRFPTLLRDAPEPPALEGPTAPSRGVCEVVLYTPTHTGSLATLTNRELARVIAIWTDRSAALFEDPALRSVMPARCSSVVAGSSTSSGAMPACGGWAAGSCSPARSPTRTCARSTTPHRCTSPRHAARTTR